MLRLINSYPRKWGIVLFHGLNSSHPKMLGELFSGKNIKNFFRVFFFLRDCNGTRTHNHLVRTRTLKHPNDWAVLWVLIYTVHLTLLSYHITYAFHREFTVYSFLNVKKFFPENKHDIWISRNCNETLIHHHLLRKVTHNHLA